MASKKTIGTHNGCFHCDEALACFMIKCLPEYKDCSILRSRDNKVLDTCDIVVDVGGKYDPSTHRYDHHMKEFTETFDTIINDPKNKSDIKLSSAGLIYCHFGKRVIKEIKPQLSEADLSYVFNKVYNGFIQEIDAIDNGVPICEDEQKYFIGTHLSARVAHLNPPWNGPKDVDVDKCFDEAVALTGEEFVNCIHRAITISLPARNIVQEAVDKRFEIDPSGEIIVLSTGAPWQEFLFKLEEELKLEPTIKYVIFEDVSWRIRSVSIAYGSFVLRIPLPKAWNGLRDEELCKVSGIDDCTFAHATGFIGGNKTREGAIKMARKSLEISKAEQKS